MKPSRNSRRLGRTTYRRSTPGKLDQTGLAALSGRELQIARLVADRKTNLEIAAELFLSPKTVEAHLRTAFRKAERDLARRARARGRARRPGLRRKPLNLGTSWPAAQVQGALKGVSPMWRRPASGHTRRHEQVPCQRFRDHPSGGRDDYVPRQHAHGGRDLRQAMEDPRRARAVPGDHRARQHDPQRRTADPAASLPRIRVERSSGWSTPTSSPSPAFCSRPEPLAIVSGARERS